MRIVVVTGTVLAEQQRLWSACRELGAGVSIVGTRLNSYQGRLPWHSSTPESVPCILLPVLSPARRRGLLWWWLKGLAGVLREHQPDVVHVLSEPWAIPVQQALLARRRGPFKVVAHGADNLYRFGGFLEDRVRARVLGYTLPRLDGFVSWNSAGVEHAKACGLRSTSPTAVIPAVIPDERLFSPVPRAAARRRLGLPRDQRIVGFIGRIEPEKGVADLVAAVRLLRTSGVFAAFWGSGSLSDAVQTEISGQGLGRVFPALPLGDVPQALAACDVVVLPSRSTPTGREQFGRVAVEAMFQGTPLVAYATGALPEVIGSSGVLVTDGDVRGLARSIDNVLADRVAARAMADAARTDARSRFGADGLSRRMLGYWRDVLSQ